MNINIPPWATCFSYALSEDNQAIRGSSSPKESDESTLLQLEMKGVDNVEKGLEQSMPVLKHTRLESTLSFLATTGSGIAIHRLLGRLGHYGSFRGIVQEARQPLL